jgi:uridine kinase
VNSPVILGIAGASGSGKTTLAEELARELEGTHFHLDHYYRDFSHLSYEERCRKNFDHPDELESDLLIAHVSRLADGHAIHVPQYDFAQHTRIPGRTKRLEAGHLVIVDGIFALYYEGLRALYDFSVYVDAPDQVCYQRRLARDVRQRGRTAESVSAHYAETVRPMAEQYVRPTSRYADLVVDGTASLDWSVEQVMTAMRTRGLLEILNAR